MSYSLFLNSFTSIDIAYFEKKEGLLGDSFLVDLFIEGSLDEQGFVFDFSPLKKQAKKIIDQFADHVLILPTLNPNLKIKKNNEQILTTLFQCERWGKIFYEAPLSSFFHLKSVNFSIDTFAKDINQLIFSWLMSNPLVSKRIKKTKIILKRQKKENNASTYYYTHGLKKHNGNCQRMGHGHQGILMIYENNKRSNFLEKKITTLFSNIHICDKNSTLLNNNHYTISYQATQGKFKLILPQKKCLLLEEAPTIEHITHFTIQYLKKKNPHTKYKVIMYEGINKGASFSL